MVKRFRCVREGSLSIPLGNTKTGPIPSFAISPVKYCPNCLHCARQCYARRLEAFYPSCKTAWGRNGKAAENGGSFAVDMHNFLFKRHPAFFRVHVSGDFYSRRYFQTWIGIAEMHRETRFMAFTKAFDTVAEYRLPSNLKIIHSLFPSMPETRDGAIGPCETIAFAGKAEDYRDTPYADRAIAAKPCNGLCSECLECYNGTRDVMIPLH